MKQKPLRKGKALETRVHSELERLHQLRGYIYFRPDAKFIRVAGIYADKQPCDFVLLAGGKGVWLIECKETCELIWSPTHAASEYQRICIDIAERLGYQAGFLVHFTRSNALRWIQKSHGKFTVNDGQEWDWQKFYE